MITANDVCIDVQVLNILMIFKQLISMAMIVVPVLLVIFLIIDIIKTVGSSEVDTKKLFKSVSNRIIAAVVTFLVPLVLNFALSLIPENSLYYVDCYNNATKENIEYIALNNAIRSMSELDEALLNKEYYTATVLYEQARKDVRNIQDKEIREEKYKTLEIYKAEIQELKDGYVGESPDLADTSAADGDYQTDATASKYTYDYIKKNLNKYKGLSEDRINIVLTAASYAGEIPYYWGGKASSKILGANNFGSTVKDDGYGRTKKGLDCSHFVDFVYWQVMDDNLGNSNTRHIWNSRSYSISEDELLPGDVAFKNDPSESGVNHIGIFAGVDDKGNKIWIHLSGRPNNTVVINNSSKLVHYRRIDIMK